MDPRLRGDDTESSVETNEKITPRLAPVHRFVRMRPDGGEDTPQFKVTLGTGTTQPFERSRVAYRLIVRTGLTFRFDGTIQTGHEYAKA